MNRLASLHYFSMPLRSLNMLKSSGVANFTKRFVTTKMEYTDIKIPVPWGEIVGKWWGSQKQQPVLTLHGWQVKQTCETFEDNCGTFDTLIPLLPKHVSFLAIDFPGHGFSSSLPVGIYHHNSINLAIVIRRIQQYFGWKKMSLMGHSMGAFVSFVYATTFPECVNFLICFDFLKPLILPDMVEGRGRNIDKFLEYDKLLEGGKESPSYTLEELKIRYYEGTAGSVDLDHAHYILERNIRPSANNQNKFYFARDPRQKVQALINYPREELKEAGKKLTMPIFLSRGKESPDYEKKEYFEEVVEVVRKSSSDFRFYMVPGTHHHHLNTPESVSGLVSEFLNKYYKGEDITLANKL